MSEEERAAQRRGDSVDEIDTSDLERQYSNSEESSSDEEEEQDQEAINFLIENRINLARAFYGKNGGFTVRKLKKFYK